MEWASAAYTAAALVCAAAATVLALVHIYRHLLHYAEPIYQRFIVRMIFMVPVMLPVRRLYLTLFAQLPPCQIYCRFREKIPFFLKFEGASKLLAGIRPVLGDFAGVRCLPTRICDWVCLCY